MKQFLLITGLSLCSIPAFSQQQVASTKKTPAPVTKEKTVQGQQPVASDSVTVNSIKRMLEPTPVEQSSGTNQQAPDKEEKPVVNTTKRKPE